jgi:hypothetical protein
MTTRRDEIDEEIALLRKLAAHLTEGRTLDGVRDLIAELEAEQAALSD